MPDDISGNDGRSLVALLSDIQEFLRLEQRMAGDTLFMEQQKTRKDDGVSTGKQPVTQEPALFQMPTIPATGEAWSNAETLRDLDAQICNCLKCGLGHTRTKFVFGVGNPKATLMLVGEAPGADEDAKGEPFVGRAGQLLNKILEAIALKREDVYICNILKCRPPGNRKPQPDEVEQCIPYLKKQIALIKPRVILCLGLTAAENLLKTTESLSKLRGRVMEYEGTPLMVTYHPAALLRNPAWKRPAWEDVQAVMKLHNELIQR